MPKLTKRAIDALRPAAKDQLVWDDEVRGFGVRVKPSGVKSYLIQYRNAHGRSRRFTLGKHGVLTLDEARRQAKKCLSPRVAAGGSDPAEERQLRSQGARPVATSATGISPNTSRSTTSPARRPRSSASWRR